MEKESNLIEEIENLKKELKYIGERVSALEFPAIYVSEPVQYEIIDTDDYVEFYSRQDVFPIKFHREFDKSKDNHNWVEKNKMLITLDVEGIYRYGTRKPTLIMSPVSGIFETIKNRNIKENELFCRIRKYNDNDKQKVFEEIERIEIRQNIIAKERKKLIERETMDELISEGKIFNYYTKKNGNRETIPVDVATAVWNRDGGKCCICGSHENLEFDHIIPISKGGATTFRNLQLLCHSCNLKKSDKI